MKNIPFTNRQGRCLLLALFVGLLCTSQATAAESARVTTTASQTSLQVAEPFWLDWTVTAPAGAKVTFPAIGEKLGDFDILDTQDLFDIPSAKVADQRTWTRRLQLESIVTGELEVPALEIQVGANSDQVLHSQAVPVQVVSVLEERGDPTQFRDIQSVVDVPVPSKPSHAWIGWTLAGVSVLALSISAVVFTRRKRWLTPTQWATQQLDALEANSHEQNGDASTGQLAAIMQSFLQLQFALPAPGRTSEEFLQLLSTHSLIEGRSLENLRKLFTTADEAKFARLPVSPAEFQALLQQARSLVGQVTQAPVAETSSTAPETTEAN